MLARLGPIMQIAFVPQNFDAALAFWTNKMGVGPFFRIDDVKLESVRYLGKPAQIPFSIALAYWGEIQIELIKPRDRTPSIYARWLDEGKEGVHHTCILVDDMTAARDAVRAQGAMVLQEAIVPSGGEVFYADTGGGDGTMLEILKPAPGGREFFEMMKSAARDWDGRDPVRKIG